MTTIRMTDFDTTDPALTSWVPVPAGSDFPIQNLPYGIATYDGGEPRVVVAIGEHVVDLAALARWGLFDEDLRDARSIFASPTLHRFAASSASSRRAVRRRLCAYLSAGEGPLARAEVLLPAAGVTLHCPIAPGDFADFLASAHHARNVAAVIGAPAPLPPQWNDCPIAYQGRAGTVIGSESPVLRPSGPQRGPDGAAIYGPSKQLDYELEVGIVIGGPPTQRGQAVSVADAPAHILGLTLLNDWSARDLQFFESQPLGPFLGKSFATSISPWVVPLEALAPYRVTTPRRDGLHYLHENDPWGLSVELEAWLTPRGAATRTRLCRSNLSHLHWTIAQQIAHLTVGGASIRPGDLVGTGTVSGPNEDGHGCLLEQTFGGRRPLQLDGGGERAWLEDGDRIEIFGFTSAENRPRIGFGKLAAMIIGTHSQHE